MKKYEVKRPAAMDLNVWQMDFHEVMLADTVRMEAFRWAIYEVVKPGDVVVDLGTGTGILSQMAFEAGASKVYGIEFNKDILEVAKQQLGSFGERFIPILGNSLNVELPEKVDVIISETIGNFADNENNILFLKDAKKRFLKSGGVMIPQKVSQILVPVESSQVEENIKNAGLGKLNYFETVIPGDDYAADAQVVNLFCFEGGDTIEYAKEVNFNLKFDATSITGFKGWFKAELSPSVVLDTEFVEENSSWNHFYVSTPRMFSGSQKDVCVQVEKKDGCYKITNKKYEKNSIR